MKVGPCACASTRTLSKRSPTWPAANIFAPARSKKVYEHLNSKILLEKEHMEITALFAAAAIAALVPRP